MKDRIRIGTRGSRLALAQTELVKAALADKFPGLECETVIIKTKGDRVQDKPLSAIGGAGVFAGEVEASLLSGDIDIAVHSAKDLPTLLADGLEVRCVLKRADPRDVILYRKEFNVTSGSPRIGTGSIRRRTFFSRCFHGSEPKFFDIRGNVDTRIKKLREGMYDGIILAAAGLERLGLLPFDDDELECELLPVRDLLPAPCQAIIAVESRIGEYCDILDGINYRESFISFNTERYILRMLGGDCSKPIGAYTEVRDGRIRILVSVGGETVGAEGEAIEWKRLAEGLVRKL
ncbi:MAG: hydroxymethylbilane synthase [Ruminococcus sp.]|nr:hydroxymethylbilane synthase [Ruminococcus sp.]